MPGLRGRTLAAPELMGFAPLAALITLGAAIALIRFKANVLLVITAWALAGWVTKTML